MKKITFIVTFLVGLFSTSIFGQTVAWTNPVEIISENSLIDVNLTWDTEGKGDLDFICIWVRELSSTGTAVNDYGAFSDSGCLIRGDNGANNPDGTTTTFGNVDTTSVTIDVASLRGSESIPLSEDLPAGNSYILSIFMAVNGGASANGSEAITVGTEEDVSLSINDFSRDGISNFVSQSKGVITIDDSLKTETYKMYDLTGAKVVDKKADGSIDVSGLPSGVYIIATDIGLVKVAF